MQKGVQPQIATLVHGTYTKEKHLLHNLYHYNASKDKSRIQVNS